METDLERLETTFKNIALSIPSGIEFVGGLVEIIIRRNPLMMKEKND